ncbi:MAG: CPBP family intramembrane metalloprotease [Clostridia bacterium]|nr:CPBP family intramembrane metalloprotease [Clostridia bacterium]
MNRTDYIYEDNLTRSVRDNTRRTLLGYAVFTLVWIAADLLLTLLAVLFAPGLLDTDWFIWVINEVPLYCVAFPVLWFGFIRRTPPARIDRSRVPVLQYLGLILPNFTVMIAGSIIGRFVSQLFALFPFFSAVDLLQSIMDAGASTLYTVLAFVCTVVIAPIMEELIFRKILIDRTVALGQGTAVLLSGLLFGLFHGNFYQFFYTFFFGMILAFLYVRTGRIVYTMIMHAIVNFVMGFLPTLMEPLYESLEAETVSLSASMAVTGYVIIEYGLAILGIPLLIVAIRDMKRQIRPSPFSVSERRPILWRAPGLWMIIGASVLVFVLNLL